jgi:hypothetical protein
MMENKKISKQRLTTDHNKECTKDLKALKRLFSAVLAETDPSKAGTIMLKIELRLETIQGKYNAKKSPYRCKAYNEALEDINARIPATRKLWENNFQQRMPKFVSVNKINTK